MDGNEPGMHKSCKRGLGRGGKLCTPERSRDPQLPRGSCGAPKLLKEGHAPLRPTAQGLGRAPSVDALGAGPWGPLRTREARGPDRSRSRAPGLFTCISLRRRAPRPWTPLPPRRSAACTAMLGLPALSQRGSGAQTGPCTSLAQPLTRGRRPSPPMAALGRRKHASIGSQPRGRFPPPPMGASDSRGCLPLLARRQQRGGAWRPDVPALKPATK